MIGRFITFEGIEGSGKSTQLRLLALALEGQGIAILTTREPGGTDLGRRVRELVLHGDQPVEPIAELMLYAADRAQHMAEIVEPALTAGRTVLCDRHADSLVAYQAFGRLLDRALVDELNRIATRGRLPDLTFVFDLAPEQGLQRAVARGAADRLERESLEFHERVREGFRRLAEQFPLRIRLIDAHRPSSEIHRDVLIQADSVVSGTPKAGM